MGGRRLRASHEDVQHVAIGAATRPYDLSCSLSRAACVRRWFRSTVPLVSFGARREDVTRSWRAAACVCPLDGPPMHGTYGAIGCGKRIRYRSICPDRLQQDLCTIGADVATVETSNTK